VDKLAAKINEGSGYQFPFRGGLVNLGMEPDKLKQSLQNSQPPQGLNIYLQALWYDGKGDWEKSHELIQDLPDSSSARIHAYLHRKEGDQGNALYWYRRAGEAAFRGSLEEEWEFLVGALDSL